MFFDPFAEIPENTTKNGVFDIWIQVFPKVVYGMRNNVFCISSFLPSCIFKQDLRTSKPHKNRPKFDENDLKIGQKLPIFLGKKPLILVILDPQNWHGKSQFLD